MPAIRPFKILLEQRLGKLPQLLIYAVLEWIMIVLLLADGMLTFFSNEFAKCFGLKVPCLLCTRIDHLLVQKKSSFYYNDSICETHKKGISSLAYCQAHKNLSDIRSMCQSCLLSTEKDADSDRYKSLVGILHKDADRSVENNDQKLSVRLAKKDVKQVVDENVDISDCSCCGETLKSKPSSRLVRNMSMNFAPAPNPNPAPGLIPSPSPRASFLGSRYEEGRNVESPRFRYSEARQILDNKSNVIEDDASNVYNQGKEDAKATMAASPLQDPKDPNEDFNRTPRFNRGNKLLGIPLNSAPASPRWINRGSISRKLSVDRGDFIAEPTDTSSITEAENDILTRLRSQVRLDHNSLMELYMELDEERNASNVAANNAMAMITRLQAEKAAVQMEALQYQRMMEEQMEYDEEAFQVLKDMLEKRDEDVKDLESELELYREKYGFILKEDSEFCVDEDYLERKSHESLPSFGENSDSGSINGADQIESDHAYEFYMESVRENQDKLSLDFDGEKSPSDDTEA